MKWVEAKSLDELKTIGSFQEVKSLIKRETNGKFKINYKSWETLYDSVRVIQDTLQSSLKIDDKKYFTSKATEYIFYLLELDGEIRTRKLGITKIHYSNKKKAKEWRDKISKFINPDKCSHLKAEEAMDRLNNMYKSMVTDE